MSGLRSLGIVVLVALATSMSAACGSAGSREPAKQPGPAAGPATNSAAVALADPAAVTVAFHSNGCSGFREARFFSCCFTHDLAYWAGGNRADRRRTDLALRRCLIDISHDRFLADFAYFLVILWAGVGEVVDTGWARAWRGTGHGRYDPLSPGQKLVVAFQRQRICDGLRLNPKTGRYRVDDTTDPWREVWPAQARQICGQ